jgi:hypothetical protein
MSRRVVIGSRANGDVGLFVSPPGVDAFTAPDSSLLLNVTEKVSQLILMGRVTSSQTIALGLSRSPVVIVTSQYDWASVIGHTLGPGPFRPSPGPGASSSNCIINGNGASITVQVSLPTVYQVYNQAIT